MRQAVVFRQRARVWYLMQPRKKEALTLINAFSLVLVKT